MHLENHVHSTGRPLILDRRNFLKTAGLGALALAGHGGAFAQEAPQAVPPNIVVIVADDLGYAEIDCYGDGQIPTPAISSLAKSGVRCTDGYVSAPVCSPTRAGLITGRYQQRFGHEYNPGPVEEAPAGFGLPLSEKTIAQYMKEAGYATGLVGKWHLGYTPEYHPMQRGFDEFFGFLGGSHPYLPTGAKKDGKILRGADPVNEPEYLTDVFAREASAFIERHAEHPFFLYLPFNGVHSPMQTCPRHEDRFQDISDRKRRTFTSMLTALDEGVGAVLNTLRAKGLEERTLVFFISDNGGPTLQTTSRNNPFSGYKGGMNEGGIRVPFLVQWKGTLPADSVVNQPVSSLDILPTALAAAGQPVPADSNVDGINLLPVLKGNAGVLAREALYWRSGDKSAVRRGAWKRIREKEGRNALYNLADDPAEQKDLAGENEALVAELDALYATWDAKNVPPKWPAKKKERRTKRRKTEE